MSKSERKNRPSGGGLSISEDSDGMRGERRHLPEAVWEGLWPVGLDLPSGAAESAGGLCHRCALEHHEQLTGWGTQHSRAWRGRGCGGGSGVWGSLVGVILNTPRLHGISDMNLRSTPPNPKSGWGSTPRGHPEDVPIETSPWGSAGEMQATRAAAF